MLSRTRVHSGVMHHTKAISNEHLNPNVLSRPYLNASLQWAEENHTVGESNNLLLVSEQPKTPGAAPAPWHLRTDELAVQLPRPATTPCRCGRERRGPSGRRGVLRRQRDATRETQHRVQVKHALLCSEAVLNTSLQTSAIRRMG